MAPYAGFISSLHGNFSAVQLALSSQFENVSDPHFRGGWCYYWDSDDPPTEVRRRAQQALRDEKIEIFIAERPRY